MTIQRLFCSSKFNQLMFDSAKQQQQHQQESWKNHFKIHVVFVLAFSLFNTFECVVTINAHIEMFSSVQFQYWRYCERYLQSHIINHHLYVLSHIEYRSIIPVSVCTWNKREMKRWKPLCQNIFTGNSEKVERMIDDSRRWILSVLRLK